MPREFSHDPEVEADRRRRESAPTPPSIEQLERPDPRLVALYSSSPGAIVETWPCRTCGADVEMTATAIATARERIAAFNRQLAVRREPLIDADEVMVCGACRELEAAELQRPAQRDLRLEGGRQ